MQFVSEIGCNEFLYFKICVLLLSYYHWCKCGIRNCRRSTVTPVTDIPIWRVMFLVSFTIVDFVVNTQYSLVFRVIFNVLLNIELKSYRFSHSLIALKWRNRPGKTAVIRVTAKDKLLLISVIGIRNWLKQLSSMVIVLIYSNVVKNS